MNINKAQWVTEGDNVRLSMPIGKVDKDRRMVSGFATLDNVDKQGDVVDTTASLNAFKSFRGNLREMHQPSAVGKVVSFKEDRYFDPQSKKFYSGVYVSAYVSKGAQDAWEKVLDGTYSGFSIGGSIKKYDDMVKEDSTEPVRVIKEYDLHELSLVDNPANQFANIFSIEKNESGESVVDGYLSKTEIENVFWDSANDIVMLSGDDSALSPTSGEPMQNIGFVEKADSDSSDVIKFLVDSAKGINTIEMNKEVSPMTDETQNLVEKADEAVSEEVIEKSEEVAPEAVATTETEIAKSEEVETEKSADMDEDDKEKMDHGDEEEEDMEDMKAKGMKKSDADVSDSAEVVEATTLDKAVESAVADLKDTVTQAFSDLSGIVKAQAEAISELSKALDSVKSEVTDSKSVFDEFGKRVDAVEQDTAFRKSGDLGEIVQEPEFKVQKSLWGGRFLTNNDLF